VTLPLVIAIQFLLTLSLVFFLATVYVTFRDTEYLTGIFLMLGFYLTPIFYPASSIPPQYQLIYRLNPMVDLIASYRRILVEGQFPAPVPLAMIAIVSLLLLWLGYRIFVRASYQFAEEL